MTLTRRSAFLAAAGLIANRTARAEEHVFLGYTLMRWRYFAVHGTDVGLAPSCLVARCSSCCTSARRRDRGSKRKGASRETVKSNGVFVLARNGVRFLRRKPLGVREGTALSLLAAVAAHQACRRQAGNVA